MRVVFETMNGGQLLVECLVRLGARRGFGVPGESYLAVLDGLYSHQNAFDFVTCRHEGGAAYMAEAWARLTGQPGLCFVTRGPGATNASVGVHTAMQGSTPMILFVGQAGRSELGRECFQEIDYEQMFGGMAKWATQIEDPARIPEIVTRAWVLCQSGRPGPVVISLPEDVLSAEADAPLPTRISLPSESVPEDRDMAGVQTALAKAHKPLILVGGGGWTREGLGALERFAEGNGLPVVTAVRYHNHFDNRSPNFVGEAGVGMLPYVNEALRNSDLILALNVRFGEMTTAAYTLFDPPFPKQNIIHIHPEPGELGKVLHPQLAVAAGPNATARALSELEVKGDWDAWRADLRDRYETGLVAPAQPGRLDMSEVMQFLRSTLDDDAILTSGAGNFSIWTNKHFDYGADQMLLAPQVGTMGYGLPAGIAARLEYPGRQVIVFAGDGDFQMTLAELGTALQAKATPVVLVLNNQSYGTIRMHQERHYPDRVSGTEIVNPDFVTIAKGYGMHAERVETTNEFAAAFQRALESGSGALLELIVDIEGITPRARLKDIRGKVPAH